MKAIAINGSPNKNGNTAIVLKLMAEELSKEGIEVETIQIGDKKLHGCTACGYCMRPESEGCVFKDDIVNETAQKMREADGIILGAPTYYGGIPGTMKSFLDRVFFSDPGTFKYKVGAAVAVVRRAGGVDVTRQLHNYFDLAEILTPPSQYWMAAYGMDKSEVLQDFEGIQTIRKNARAFAWLLKVVSAGREKFPTPPEEDRIMTNFIR
jgi:multimeric flavodoxin WrbA